MLSDFRKKKIEKLFWFWDADANNSLEKKDYALVGEKLAQERNWAKGSPEYDFLMNKLMEDWAEAEKFADTNRDNKISIDEWNVFCDAFTMDKDMYLITVTNVASAIFDACDVDKNGILEDFEWKILFRIYGKTDAEAMESFNAITTNGKIKLDRARVLSLLDEFFYAENKNITGNYMFGNLN